MSEAAEKSEPSAGLIVLFDGECGLCDHAVQFILARDPKKKFRFAPLQSQPAHDLLAKHDLKPEELNSVALLDGDKLYLRSNAALRIALELPDPWPLAGALVFIPESLRNAAYDFIARHRRQWFNKPDACRTPTPEEREQFLV